MITSYSICSAVLYFNIAILLVYALRRNTVFLAKYSVNTLIIITILGLIRVFLPFDTDYAFVIRSDEFIPWLENEILAKELLGYTVSQIIIFLWIMGAICVLLYYVATVLKEVKQWNAYENVCPEDYLPVIHELCAENVEVVVSPLIDMPQCLGLVKPRIYLPDSNYSEHELRYILLHEMQHIKSRDSHIKLFYMILTALFWWNPIMYIFGKELDRILELRCDDKVISAMSMEEKIAYLEIMLTVQKSLNPSIPHYNSLYAFIDPEEDLTQRFKLIATHHKKSKRAFITVVIVAMLVFTLSYFFIIQPYTAPNMGESVGTFSITADNAYLVQISADMYCVKFYDEKSNNSQPMILTPDKLLSEPFSQLEIREIEEE